MRKLILLFFFSSCYCFGIGRKQTVGVMGKLLCNGKPAAGVEIRLYEKEIFFDRKLAQVITGNNGSFTILGTARELSDLDPQLNIYHNCNFKGPCRQKLKIMVPTMYVYVGKQLNYFNIKTLELAKKFTGQKTDCITYADDESVWEKIEPLVTYLQPYMPTID